MDLMVDKIVISDYQNEFGGEAENVTEQSKERCETVGEEGELIVTCL